jgi:hypothetical protein
MIDSEGTVHAVWQDETADFIYTRLDGDQWSAPETTDLNRIIGMPIPRESSVPSQSTLYTGPNPLFIAGPGQYLFAFWITRQGKLFTSRVTNQNFDHISVWDTPGVVASDVASFAVSVDPRGDWHLAYFHTVDEPNYPAGIYYTRSRSGGWNWAVPELIYESPYIRSLGEGEAELSIATSGTEEAVHVYIAWDNRPRKQVLLAQSADGGKSWEQPAVIAGPAPDSGLAGPFNIQVGANKDSVVLVWQNGRPDSACSQFFQSSGNGGVTWSEPQPMLEKVSECPNSNEIVTGLVSNPRVPPRLYLLTETQTQIFLTAWNGIQWSEPQAQTILSGFEDPEIYKQVIYGCHRASLSGERLYVIGCDQGNGGDVWVTSLDVGSSTSWFNPPLWNQPSPVIDENLEMDAVELAATDDGLIHAFFSQYQDPTIYYTYWDGELWSRVTPVLKLPEGEAAWPVVAAGPGNELFLIARNNRGALYLSRANSGDAATASNWSTPTQLALAQNGEIGSVALALDADGTVYAAYSVPVNEKRGIYLIQSKDHGTSWSEPLQVFNGAAAGFELVGAPSLLASENGILHITWKQQSIQGDGIPQPISLYYARSEDGGNSFSDAEPVVEEPVAWRDIVTDGNGNLHLLWQPQGTLTTVWDQVSMDGGHSWQYPQGLPIEGKLVAVEKDTTGQLHLMDIGQSALGHWLWDNSRWQSEAPLDLNSSSQDESPADLLAATVNDQGKMMVVLAKPTGEGDVTERSLLYSTRTLELPGKQTVIEEVPTQALLPSTLTSETPAPERSLTPAGTVDSEPTNPAGQTDLNQTKGSTSPLTVALIPVALLLLTVLGFMIRQATRGKDR